MIPSGLLMIFPESSAGRARQRPSAEHTAMWFHFSSAEALRRNNSIWGERKAVWTIS